MYALKNACTTRYSGLNALRALIVKNSGPINLNDSLITILQHTQKEEFKPL